jgi:hypothetical protein
MLSTIWNPGSLTSKLAQISSDITKVAWSSKRAT